MKTTALVFAILAAAGGASVAQNIAEVRLGAYPVEHQRFQSAYAAVRKSIDAAQKLASLPPPRVHVNAMQARGFGMGGEIPRHPGVELTRWDFGTRVIVMQTLAPGDYLARIGEEIIRVAISGQPLADDQPVRGNLTLLPGLHTYTTTLGATATVKQYRLDPTTDATLTPEDLRQRLQSGETIIIENGKAEAKCPDCQGWGRIPGPRVGSPKSPCKKCRETGKILAPSYVKLLW